MNTNSNSYTIIYASVMVIIVAFLLAFVNSSLKETQNKNIELDTKKQILTSLNASAEDLKDADAAFAKYQMKDMLLQEGGKLAEYTDKKFPTSFEKEAKENNRLHVFVADVNGEKKYVFPGIPVPYSGRYLGLCSLEQRQRHCIRCLLLSCQRNSGSGC